MSDYFEMKQYIEQRQARGLDTPELDGAEVLALIAENEELKHKVSAGAAREWDLQNQIRESRESRANVVESNKALRKEIARLTNEVRSLLENPGDAL